MAETSQEAHRLQRIGVVGAGAFGTSLAIALRRAGRDTLLFARRPEQAAELETSRENKRYLPGIILDPEIAISAEPVALAACEYGPKAGGISELTMIVFFTDIEFSNGFLMVANSTYHTDRSACPLPTPWTPSPPESR